MAACSWLSAKAELAACFSFSTVCSYEDRKPRASEEHPSQEEDGPGSTAFGFPGRPLSRFLSPEPDPLCAMFRIPPLDVATERSDWQSHAGRHCVRNRSAGQRRV